MSELDGTGRADAPAPAGESAGSLLRQARLAQGLHIAALAAQIKVTPRKLEALEADRYDELPDATFTRALAQAVCRALKVDPAPVMARLPDTGRQGLQPVPGGLNERIRPHEMRHDGGTPITMSRPALWALGLLVAAVVVYFFPANLLPARWRGIDETGVPSPAASAVVTPVPASGVGDAPPGSTAAPVIADPAASTALPVAPASSVVAPASGPAPLQLAASAPTGGVPAPAAPAPTAPVAVAPPAASAPASPDALRIAATGASWVEVSDGRGRVLLSRTLQAGESVLLDGAAPLRVKLGNAPATQLSFRGQPVALPGRDTVVRLELK